MTAPLAVTVRYDITQIYRCGCCVILLTELLFGVYVHMSLPTVPVLTLLVFREALACHRSLGTQQRAGKTHVKIYSHWAWLQAAQLAAIWQTTFNRSYRCLCILMSLQRESSSKGQEFKKAGQKMHWWFHQKARQDVTSSIFFFI